MSEYYKSRGIILNERPAREHDMIKTCYLEKFGLLDLYAPGLLLEKSKLRMHVTKFALCEVIFVGVSEGYRLTDAFLIRDSWSFGAIVYKPLVSMSNFLLDVIQGTLVDEEMWKLVYRIYGDGTCLPQTEKQVLALKNDVLHILGIAEPSTIKSEADVKKILSLNHIL